MAVAAVLSGALHFGLNFVGLRLAENVSSVAIAGQLGIPFTTLLSIALLGEIVRWRRWLGITLAFVGVVRSSGFDPQMTTRWASLALVVASAFAPRSESSPSRSCTDFGRSNCRRGSPWISIPLLLRASLQVEHPDFPRSRECFVHGMGRGRSSQRSYSSIGAHTGYFYLIQRYPLTSIAPLTTLSPIFAILFERGAAGRSLSARIWLGGGLHAGRRVLIITLRERRIVDIGT